MRLKDRDKDEVASCRNEIFEESRGTTRMINLYCTRAYIRMQ